MRIYLLLVAFFTSIHGNAQTPPYPKYYFRNPMGIPMQLAANYGEMRPNHWHMGLDIRTNQKENLPVYAAAGGYVAHIGIRPQSWGRYIIINHPNGYSTLYAHLNDFYTALEDFVTTQQYKEETWSIEIDFSPEQFPVLKGQWIANSGNTGGSQGPHLHFEIRDTKTQKCLNPLLFGFPFEDDVPPTLVKLAVYDGTRSLYEQSPLLYSLKNTEGGYVIPKLPVMETGMDVLNIALQAYDRSTGSKNPNGIFAAQLFLDDTLVSGFVLDSIDYDESTLIHAQVDHRYYYNGGTYLQLLSPLPGDPRVVYPTEGNSGLLRLPDTSLHRVRIEVLDVFRNRSQLEFSIRYSDSLARLQATNDIFKALQPKFSPNQENHFSKPDFELMIPPGAIFDTIKTVYFRNNSNAPFAVSAIHQMNDPSWPLQENILVKIKPDRTIPDAWKDHLVMQRTHRGSQSLRKVKLEDEWLAASFGDFGVFQAFADLVAPELNELGKKGKGDTIDLSAEEKIQFQPRDNFGVIANFRAELDGKWLRFTNDKSRTWVYKFDERCPYGVHELKVSVEDLAGNVTTKTWWFRKNPYKAPKKKTVSKKSSTKGKTKKKK